MSAIQGTWRTRTSGVLLGIAIAVTGLVVLVWPAATVVVVGLLLGIGLVLYGIRELLLTPAPSPADGRGGVVAIGIVSVLAGLAVLFLPLVSAVGIGIIIGIAWVFQGVASLLGAFTESGHRLLRGLVGAISVVAGVLVLVQPGLSLVAIAWFAGAWMIGTGIAVVLVALFGRESA